MDKKQEISIDMQRSTKDVVSDEMVKEKEQDGIASPSGASRTISPENGPANIPRTFDEAQTLAIAKAISDSTTTNPNDNQHTTELRELLDEKTKELHLQRLKIKQFEFAMEEAILFLSKPLNSYQAWIENEGPETINIQFNVNPRVSSGNSNPTNTNTLPAKTQAKPNPSTTSPADTKQGLSSLETTCLENMRLCFNFLRNCQKLTKALDDGSYHIPTDTQIPAGQDESLALLQATSLPKDPSSDIQKQPSPKSSIVQMNGHSGSKGNINSVSPFTSARPSQRYTEDTGGDLSLELLDDFKPSLTSKSQCDKCRAAYLQLDIYQDKLKAAEKEISSLESRLSKEISARKVAQQGKDMIDKEIEEITAELFSRANQMVVDESKKMDMLATSNRELSKKTKDFASRLQEKEAELANATKKLYETQGRQQFRTSFIEESRYSGVESRQTGSVESQQKTTKSSEEFNHYIVSGFDQFKCSTAADGYLFQEFQDLIKVLVTSLTLPSIQAYTSIHNTPFMKRCMIESIEPCLFYTYAPTTSFKNIQVTAAHSVAFKKKLLDSVIKGQVVCSPISAAADTGEAGAASFVKQKCFLCTLHRTCEYKIHTTLDVPPPPPPTTTSSTSGNTATTTTPSPVKSDPLCRFCRDRVLSVQDFFSFVTLLSTNSHGMTILSTFKYIMWTRRRMAVAVIGSCSLYETEISAILGPGTHTGNWEKLTKTLY